MTQRHLYGRRIGKKLRKHQIALMQELLPRIAVPADDTAAPLDPAQLFDPPVETVWLEIGFGGGEHLTAQASAHPEVGFIGCEPFVNGVAKLLAAVERGGLDNVRIHDDDARLLLEGLKPGSIGRAFLLYPDPWPKKRHHKRRFVSPENLDLLASAMPAGAELRFATDIPDYCRWTLEHVRRHGGFEWTAERPGDWRARPDDWSPTRYEAKALAQGRTPVYLTFRRTAD